MITAGARAHVRQVHDDVQPLVEPRQVALVAPHLEPFARDAFEERGEGGENVDLWLAAAVREAVGHEPRRLLFNSHLAMGRLRPERRRLPELGRRLQVALDGKAAGGDLRRRAWL